MASFQKYNTKDGTRWLYKYYTTIDPQTGKRKQSTKRGFLTKRAAQLDAAKTEQEIASGSFIATSNNPTFKDVFDSWWEVYAPTVKPSTQKIVTAKFSKHVLPYFSQLKMRDISKAYCQEVVNKIASNIKSVNEIRMYANQVFKFAVRMDIITKNPMEFVVVPKKKSDFIAAEEERNYWDKNEVKQFLNILKKHYPFREQLIFHMLLYTGARKGEILSLTWSDINFKDKTLTLKKTLYFDDNEFQSLTSKTAASRRVISLDDESIQLLKKWRTETLKRFDGIVPLNNNDYVFTRVHGTPLRLAYLNDKLAEIVSTHNLHPVTVHGLRHTHASMLFEAGASIKEVQERLGHSDIKMTMNIYTHVTNAVKESTAKKFQDFMNGVTDEYGQNMVRDNSTKK